MRPKNQTEILIRLRRLAKDLATCNKLQTAAIITTAEGHELSFGVNDSITPDETCQTHGCIIINNHCKRCIHAEQQAIIKAARDGIKIKGTEIYTLYFPCNDCLKHIVKTGITKIYYVYDYEDEFNKQLAEKCKQNNKLIIKKLEITPDVLYSEEIENDLILDNIYNI